MRPLIRRTTLRYLLTKKAFAFAPVTFAAASRTPEDKSAALPARERGRSGSATGAQSSRRPSARHLAQHEQPSLRLRKATRGRHGRTGVFGGTQAVRSPCLAFELRRTSRSLPRPPVSRHSVHALLGPWTSRPDAGRPFSRRWRAQTAICFVCVKMKWRCSGSERAQFRLARGPTMQRAQKCFVSSRRGQQQAYSCPRRRQTLSATRRVGVPGPCETSPTCVVCAGGAYRVHHRECKFGRRPVDVVPAQN
ncbi:hypothetical protein C2E23DRAFT_93513 [Lenzites betulinus]|nr:hypothetical protein C2E23DRAFT_93513 [Lenzites betulinus]